MIVALTVRRLKPGTSEAFRRAWEPESTGVDVLYEVIDEVAPRQVE